MSVNQDWQAVTRTIFTEKATNICLQRQYPLQLPVDVFIMHCRVPPSFCSTGAAFPKWGRNESSIFFIWLQASSKPFSGGSLHACPYSLGHTEKPQESDQSHVVLKKLESLRACSPYGCRKILPILLLDNRTTAACTQRCFLINQSTSTPLSPFPPWLPFLCSL